MGMIHSATVKVIKDGRITIPSDIREIEGIGEGDYLKITIEKIEKHKVGIKTNQTEKTDT